MGININFQGDDGYMDIEVKDGKTPTTDGTEVSIFMMEALPLADRNPLDILFKNQDSIFPELLAYLQQSRILS